MTQPGSPIVDAQRRSWNYWFIDGLPTLIAGIPCVLMGVVLLADNAPVNHPVRLALVVVGLVLYCVMTVRMRRVLEWLKARITYPRTGYATPPEEGPEPPDVTVLTFRPAETLRFFDFPRLIEERKRRTGLMVGSAVTGVLFGLARTGPWACLVAGVMLGLGVLVGTRKSEHTSWLEVAAFPFAGLYTYIFHVAGPDRPACLLLIAGGVFVLSGAFRLVRYVRHNPMPSA
jgi:uncharacterized membrane protein HdeD (DUF308 family)